MQYFILPIVVIALSTNPKFIHVTCFTCATCHFGCYCFSCTCIKRDVVMNFRFNIFNL